MAGTAPNIVFTSARIAPQVDAVHAFASTIGRAGRSVEVGPEVERLNLLGLNEGATPEASSLLLAEIHQELELAQRAEVLVTDRSVVDNFAYYLRVTDGEDPFAVEPLIRRWATSYDLSAGCSRTSRCSPTACGARTTPFAWGERRSGAPRPASCRSTSPRSGSWRCRRARSPPTSTGGRSRSGSPRLSESPSSTASSACRSRSRGRARAAEAEPRPQGYGDATQAEEQPDPR